MLRLRPTQCTSGVQGRLPRAVQFLRWHLCDRLQGPGPERQSRQLRQRQEQMLEPIQRLPEGQFWCQRGEQVWQLWIRMELDEKTIGVDQRSSGMAWVTGGILVISRHSTAIMYNH